MADELRVDPEDWRRILAEHEVLWTEVKPLAEQVAADVTETKGAIVEMVNDLYGEKRPTPADRNNREGGRLERLETLGNGGVKIKLPATLWAFVTAVTVASIGAAVTLIISFSG